MPIVLGPIRKLAPAEVVSFRDIRLEALSRHPEAFCASYKTAAAEPCAATAQRLAAGGVWGAFMEDTLVGIAQFGGRASDHQRHRGELSGVYLRNCARGTGLADRLVETVLDFAKDRVECVELKVDTTNEPAIRLYGRCGFQTYGTEPRAFKVEGGYRDAFLMAKFLGE